MLTLLFATLTAQAARPTLDELLDATDDIARGTSSVATIEMQVKTDRYERSMTMKAWSEGEEKSLIVIEEPAKEKGVATLKVGDNIWNYMPKVDRTMKLPASMMSGSWMGSHFTNDDLVKSNRLAEDFTATISAEPPENDPVGVYTIDLVPKPDAPVVWGKVVVKVRADRIPVEVTYFDEDGTLVRTMSFEDVKTFDGRKMPGTMRVVPADKPGEFTKVVYDAIDFDVDLPASTFSLQSLKQ